ncbi:3157_t:CDS:2 [Ambispora gerdemannii]|uniref:3157_t:CDS:1 n=1 Tax=Ambispora gerdemannii TaxID=144530 RepID=A0A9N9G5T4_9GLOM|nr:3157_t:CDS:2 [Ambispora gerdemannii]
MDQLHSEKNQATNEKDNEENILERIILNVGGTKYETYRSTLTAYPDTFLGTMFQDRNKELLHPDGNEYFIDRDGYVFRYILQFYRTGKILWPDEKESSYSSSSSSHKIPSTPSITRQELELELDYFQIPFDHDLVKSLSYVNRAAIATVDAFIVALEQIFYKVVANFGTTVTIVFNYRQIPEIYTTQKFEEDVKKILAPFAVVDLNILEKYGDQIQMYLTSEIPELIWKLEDANDLLGNYRGRQLKMSVTQSYDDAAVRKYSRLGKIINSTSRK